MCCLAFLWFKEKAYDPVSPGRCSSTLFSFSDPFLLEVSVSSDLSMLDKKEYRTVIIPSLNGQYKVWRSYVSPNILLADKVIQTGNLLGCNDEVGDYKEDRGSNMLLSQEIIDGLAREKNWVQLLGANEMMILNFPDMWTNNRTNAIIREAWLDGILKIAVEDKGRLVTSAGLTYGCWLDLGRPDTASECADMLNKKFKDSLFHGSGYILGDPPSFYASPVMADYVHEVIPSWITGREPCPFDQVTGFSLQSISGRIMMNADESYLRYVDGVTYPTSGSTTVVKGSTFIGVDLGLPADRSVTAIPRPFRIHTEVNILGR